jgi:LacI family transcriptional regulator
MKDIAQDLGLSLITISKALRGHPDISDKTRERILQRVKELNYRPNFAARSLATGHSFLVGLVVPDLLQPFFTEIAKSLSNVLKDHDYFLLISSYDQDPDMEVKEIDLLRSLNVDALVLASCRPSPDALEPLKGGEPLLVLIDRHFEGFVSHYVGVDDVKVGMLATSHLIDIGKRKIAHIRGPKTSPGEERFQGYLQTLRKHKIPFRQEYVFQMPLGDIDIRKQAAEGMNLLLNLPQRPDAVFCFSDTIAIGAMDAICNRGLRIPDDVAVIGCGNLPNDSAFRVPLSSIDQHSKEIGERTGKLLLSLFAKKGRAKVRNIILEPELVVRESTRAPHRTPKNATRS